MDLSIAIATTNGSGSQSANAVLAKALFRQGFNPGYHNIFPSNISGLPTWAYIRVTDRGYTSRRRLHDIVVARNADSWDSDLKLLKPNGVLLYDQSLKVDLAKIPVGVRHHAIPFRELVQNVSDSIRMRKLLSNTVYVGVLQELLKLPDDLTEKTLADQFHNRSGVSELNIKALRNGRQFAREHLRGIFGDEFSLPHRERRANGDLFIDGNQAAALGAINGGCTLLAWYPITPATSLSESFQNFADKLRIADGGSKAAVVQAEDELSAISMVIGAGWTGARAMTATSGPGLSLMAEAAGLSYFAEIPSVIWNVQRAGPSTGLPTRTMQADVLAAATLSHGDTKHVLLFPGEPAECYEFAQMAFDLADQLQTLVIGMSDLDLGMNPRVTPNLTIPTEAFNRGKHIAGTTSENFARYHDTDGDGVTTRTLPGEGKAYFARGTAHTPEAAYSEDPGNFRKLLARLAQKWETAKTLVPKPELEQNPHAKVCLISYGSSVHAVIEIRERLKQSGIETSHLRLRAYPFTPEVEATIASHETSVVIEQNRDGQMTSLLRQELPRLAARIDSAVAFDGLPLCAEEIADKISGRFSSKISKRISP